MSNKKENVMMSVIVPFTMEEVHALQHLKRLAESKGVKFLELVENAVIYYRDGTVPPNIVSQQKG